MSLFGICNLVSLLKKVFHTTGFFDHKDEHTNHHNCLNNSYYQNTWFFATAWAFVVIAPYWEERG